MLTLDELLIKIDASTELLRRELNKGDASVSRFERNIDRKLGKIDKRFAQLGSNLRGVLGAFGVGFGATAIVRFADSAITAGDAIGKAAKVAGVGAEQLQELRFAFGQLAGTTDKEVDESLRRFNRRLGLAIQGTGEAKQTFRDLGIEFRTAAGTIRATDDVLEETLQKLAQIDNDAIRAARASAVFGEDAGPRLAAALGQGVGAMDALRKATPGVLSDEQVRKAEALTDALDKMSRTVGGALKGAFIDAGFAVAEFFAVTEESALRREIAQTRDEIERLQRDIEKGVRTLPGSEFGGAFGFEAQEFGMREAQRGAQIAASEDQIAEARERLAERTAHLAELEAKLNRGRADAPAMLPPPLPPGVQEIAGPPPDAGIAPATVRLGRAGAQSLIDPAEAQRVRETLRQLEEQALRSQGRMAEAIRLAADAQIAEWQRVAEETPAFADQAIRAIELINQRAEADIRALSDMTPIVEQFATTFAAAFESRGIDALLNGDIGGAVRGLAKDIAELTLRLLVLKPLTDSLAGLFGGGGAPSAVPIGPPRAGGGRVDPHHAFPVGEKGPELFVPDVPGRILNSAQLSRMGGPGIVVNQHNSVQAGLPPQWQVQTAMMARIAAAEAEKAISERLGNRR